MEVVLSPIDSLIPYARNPRVNQQAVDAVAASIKEFGFRQPIVVDEDRVVIVGHTRLLAAQKLGIAEVPVVVAKDLTPQQVKAYRLVDNKSHEKARWDYELLQIELQELDLNMEALAVNFEKHELDVILQAEWSPTSPSNEDFSHDEKKEQPKKHSVQFTEEGWGRVKEAIDRCRELADDHSISEAKCLELVCADYLQSKAE